ncbi:MAG: helix-turn-helix domain-containing protein [Ferrimicrobium sp.]
MSIRKRMYPQEKEISVLVRHCSHARYVWNLGLEQRSLWVRGPEHSLNPAVGDTVQGRLGTSHANKHSDPAKRQPPKAA